MKNIYFFNELLKKGSQIIFLIDFIHICYVIFVVNKIEN